MPWWRRCGPAPSSTPMRRAGSREVVGSGCGSSRTCARPSTRYFRAVVSQGLGATRARLGPLPLLQGSDATDLLQPSAAPLPRALETASGALPTLGQGHPHALALRDRRDAGEISPHGLRVAKGLLQAKMNRLLHGRFTNPANQRFAKHLRRYRDNLFVFLADVEAIPPNKTFASPWSTARSGGGNRTAKGAQARDPCVLRAASQRDPRDSSRQSFVLRQHPRPLGQPRAVNQKEDLEALLSVRQHHTATGRDVILSVDTKKKELVGRFKNPGRVWAQKSDAVNDGSMADGVAIPGYDLRRGSRNVLRHRAVECIEKWWR